MGIFSFLNSSYGMYDHQLKKLLAVSNNLQNIKTSGYRAEEVTFASIIQSANGSHQESTPQLSMTRNMTSYGEVDEKILTADANLKMAISGDGFYIMNTQADGNGDVRYTRDGDFKMNSEGYVVSVASGYYLQGHPYNGKELDKNTLVSVRAGEDLQAGISTDKISAHVGLAAENRKAFSQGINIYNRDSSEVMSVNMTWTPVAARNNQWKLSFSAPEGQGEIEAAESIVVDFDDAGQLVGPKSTDITVKWNEYFDPFMSRQIPELTQNISIDFGKTHISGDKNRVLAVAVDGYPIGRRLESKFSDNGLFTVKVERMSNAMFINSHKIPVAVFNSPDAFQLKDHNTFQATAEAGEPRIFESSEKGAGKLLASRLERNNISESQLLKQVMYAQQAYTYTSTLFKTVNEMASVVTSLK